MINQNVVMAVAAANPFVNKFNTVLTDLKGWLLAIDVGIVLVMIVINAIKYKQGNSAEKDAAVGDIKKTIYIGAGVFVLIWLAQYIIGVFAV